MPATDEALKALNALRHDVHEAALLHVPFDGWQDKVLTGAARDLGIDEMEAVRAFPGGAMELLEYHLAEADRRMVAALETAGLATMRIRERIAFAIRTRLEQNEPHKEAIRRAVAVLSLPQNAPLAARSLYNTCHVIWRAAGDTATDFNFYTKRMILAGVYSSTLLVWLNDESEDYAQSWAFLDRRIENVMQFEKAKGRLRSLGGRLGDFGKLCRRPRHL